LSIAGKRRRHRPLQTQPPPISPSIDARIRDAFAGGQKVKLVLAAAMWNSPHLLIMDEPTNYLDRCVI